MNAAELFLPQDEANHSPSCWARRIQLAFQQPPVSTPAPEQTQPPAAERSAPMPETARRFLNSRVGIESQDVPVYQGPATSAILSASHADAAAAGDSILLGHGYDNSTPRGLSLLAHELTHVARRREPRFVPPVVRTTNQSVSTTSNSAGPEEEVLAQQVETRVFQEATRARQDPGAASWDVPNRAAILRETVLAYPASALPQPDEVTAEQAKPLLPADDPAARWGGLPAPWEPMPESVAPAAARSSGNVRGNSSSGIVSHSTPSLLFAEQGRTISEQRPTQTAPTREEPERHVPPDLDNLARQVYLIMKRRLAAERRRELLH